MITIVFQTNDDKAVSVPENSNLLRVSLRHQGGIPFKCGAGICGTCRCKIENGIEHTDKVKQKERKHLTDADLAAGYRMACQTFIVDGDVTVSWIPMSQRRAGSTPGGASTAASSAPASASASSTTAADDPVPAT